MRGGLSRQVITGAPLRRGGSTSFRAVMASNKVIVIGISGSGPGGSLPNSGENVANFQQATTERFTDRNAAKQDLGLGRCAGGGEFLTISDSA